MKKVSLPFKLLFFSLFFFANSLQAQFEIGLQGGKNWFEGDAHCWEAKPIKPLTWSGGSFGAFARYLFSDRRFGARLHYAYLPLKFDEGRYKDLGHSERGFSGKNKASDLALELEWNLLRHKKIYPYLFGGVGLQFANYQVDWNESAQSPAVLNSIAKDKKEGNKHLILPLGMGINWRATVRLGIHIESALRLWTSDYFDGISYAGDQDKNDWYGYSMLGLTYGLKGEPDSDKDGIVDKKDECPQVFGLKQFAGCPDKDLDGIRDGDDRCPDKAGDLANKGCPDTDLDGIVDVDDNCPDVKGLADLKGCPDADLDGITDLSDECPDVKGIAAMKGCPDADGDNLRDQDDLCPNEKGTAATKGCPDADGDGIADADDKCPNESGVVGYNGCPMPDADKDGIADADDKCPNEPGTSGNGGCPVVVKKTCIACTTGINDPIFKANCANPKKLSRLGTNPEFGNSHALTPAGFYQKLDKAYKRKKVDKVFLDRIYKAMGYTGWKDARPEHFSNVVLPVGTSGMLGYGTHHGTGCYTLPDNEYDRQAFHIVALNGCDFHFMKTCGNHFFFCD